MSVKEGDSYSVWIDVSTYIRSVVTDHKMLTVALLLPVLTDGDCDCLKYVLRLKSSSAAGCRQAIGLRV